MGRSETSSSAAPFRGFDMLVLCSSENRKLFSALEFHRKPRVVIGGAVPCIPAELRPISGWAFKHGK